MQSIRILLVDDHAAFLQAAEEFLSSQPGLVVVGQASSGAAALVEVSRANPDLVLLDWNLPELNGLQVLALLKKRAKAPSIVMLTRHDFPRYREAALAIGADGFVSKTDMDEQLVPLIRRLFPIA